MVQEYEDLRVSGKLEKIVFTREIKREIANTLISPEKIFVTNITITTNKGEETVEIFGVVPNNYLGRNVEIVKSSYKLSKDRKLAMHELYVDGERVVNQPIVRRY